MISVGFLFAGAKMPVELALVMAMAVRLHIPSARLVQLSDLTTDPVPGVDEVRRIEIHDEDLIEWRCKHHQQMEGAWIIIDYDVWVQRNLVKVFDTEVFDLALTRRPPDDPTASESIAKHSPHNFGVIFQRDRGALFWTHLLNLYTSRQDRDGWLMGQVLAPLAIRAVEKWCDVIELPGEYYNYTPERKDEDVRARACVHYKGQRKRWMLERAGFSPEDSAKFAQEGEAQVKRRMMQYSGAKI